MIVHGSRLGSAFEAGREMNSAVTSTGCVYIVDDDEELSRFVASQLTADGYRVQCFRSAEQLLENGIGQVPACLLVDLMLPGLSGLMLCRELVRRRLPCSFIFFSGHASVSTTVEAMKLGAVDFLEKPCSPQQLKSSVQSALETACRIHKDVSEENAVLAGLRLLTPREKEVLHGVINGLVTKELAKRLGISHRTVDVHRSHIMEKLGVDSPTQLARIIAILERAWARSNANNFRIDQPQSTEPSLALEQFEFLTSIPRA